MQDEIDEIEKLVSESRYFEAYHNIEVLLESAPDDERLEQLKALSMAKLGSPLDAMEYFEPLWRSHSNDAESAGIMGGIYKSLFVSTQNTSYGKQSATTYLANFKKTQDYYTGINAATMSKLTGNFPVAKEIANQLIISLNAQKRDYWQEVTLAEAYLLIRNTEMAIQHYIHAHELMRNNWGAIGSVQRQLWLLDHYIRVPNSIKSFFKPPVIAVFIGHMIDAEDRESPRFKPAMEEAVRGAIRSNIESLNIEIGYCSLACGADILFVEEMLRLGKKVEIFIPFDKDDFIQTSVAFAGDQWVERFNKILEEVSSINWLTKNRFNGDDYDFFILSEVMSGAAILRAKNMDASPLLLAVLSEHSLETKTGGVRNFIESWSDNSINKVNIDVYLKEQNSETTSISTNYTRIVKNEGLNLTRAFVIVIKKESSELDIHKAILVSSYHKFLSYHSYIDDKELFIFSNFTSVMDFMKDVITTISKDNVFSAGIKMSYLNLTETTLLDNPELKDVTNLCSHAPTNYFLVDQFIAFRLAFKSEKFEIKYAGEFKSEIQDTLNVYRIRSIDS